MLNNIDMLTAIEKDLTEDEKKIVNKLNEKLQAKLTEQREYVIEHADEIMRDKNLLLDDPIHSRHVTDYNREIFVSLRMEISATNDDGQLTELAPILETFYHIPVPSGIDYLDSVNSFMNQFDEGLTDCARKIHRNDSK
jgi:hypothetical protein